MDEMQDNNANSVELRYTQFQNTCLVDLSYMRVQVDGSTDETVTKGRLSITESIKDPIADIIQELYAYEIVYLNSKRISYPLIARKNLPFLGNLRLVADVKDYYWKKVRSHLVRLHVETLLTEYTRIYLNMPLSSLKTFKKYPGLIMHRRFKYEQVFN